MPYLFSGVDAGLACRAFRSGYGGEWHVETTKIPGNGTKETAPDLEDLKHATGLDAQNLVVSCDVNIFESRRYIFGR